MQPGGAQIDRCADNQCVMRCLGIQFDRMVNMAFMQGVKAVFYFIVI